MKTAFEKLNYTRRIIYTAVFAAIGVLLPYVTAHAFGPALGPVLLPMHIPVLLCGLICGTLYGTVCGVLAPALSCLITGMPVPYPMLPIMIVELSVYGAVSGLLFRKFKLPVYLALPAAMIAGRAGYGIMFAILNAFQSGALKAAAVWTAIVAGAPGIAIQLVIIPLLMTALSKNLSGVFGAAVNIRAVNAAKKIIKSGGAKYILIKKNKIILQRGEPGISGALDVFDNSREQLNGAVVIDKIVGKAAAAVFILGKARYVYGFIMSRAAKDFLAANGIEAACGELTDVIKNRAGDGVCPIEQIVLNVEEPEEALAAIRERLTLLSKK